MSAIDWITVGECSDDYCTGCEPGCGLDEVPVYGPAPAPFFGPEPYSIAFALREQMRLVYTAEQLSDLIPEQISLKRIISG